MGIEAVLAASLIMTAGASAYAAHEQADTSAKHNKSLLDEATETLKKSTTTDKKAEEDARAAAARRKKDYQNMGRSSTILTGPMGLPGGGVTPRDPSKTMLGY
jgi:septal ring factor EnvC (AmiA/AmiB activator)